MALVTLIEATFSFLPEGAFTRNAQVRTRELVTLPAPVVQIFGDSVSAGLNESIISHDLGINSYDLVNHSIAGTTAYSAYFLLRRQLDAGIVPKAVILAYNARSYCIPLAPKFLGRFATWNELGIAAKFGLPLDDWLTSLACRGSYSLRYREELNAIARTGSGWDYFNPSVTPTLSYSERLASLPVTLPASQERPHAPEYNRAFYGVNFVPNEAIQRSLDEFFELARTHSIQVYVLSMPKTVVTAELHARNGFDKAYDDFIELQVKRHGAEWLLREQSALVASDFLDAVHLTPRAAFQFSKRVADRIRDINGFPLPKRSPETVVPGATSITAPE